MSQTKAKLALEERTGKRNVLDKVTSFCPKCLKAVDSEIVEEDGKVFLEKDCCGHFKTTLSNTPEIYKEDKFKFLLDRDSSNIDDIKDMEREYESEFSIYEVYLTLRCNLDCPICYLQYGNDNEVAEYEPPTFAELEKLVKNDEKQLIYLSGGEPTLREDLPEIISMVKSHNSTPVLCTNGLKLLDKNYLNKLKESGLELVALSFDGFKEFPYQVLRGANLLDKKLRILRNLKEVGLKVWLVPVIGRGINEGQIEPIIKFAGENGFITQVSFSPLFTGNKETERFTGRGDVIKRISDEFDFVDVECYTEQRVFQHNAYRLIKRLARENDYVQRKFSYIASGTVCFKYREGQLIPYFPPSEIKKMNDIISRALEKDNVRGVIKVLLKKSKTLFSSFLKSKIPQVLLQMLANRMNVPQTFTEREGVLRVNVISTESLLDYDLQRATVMSSFPQEVRAKEVTG